MAENNERETGENGEMRPTRRARIDDRRLSDRTERYAKEGVAYFALQRLGESGSRQLAETMQLVDRDFDSATKCKVRDSKASEDAGR